jgi:hypothetical protein
MWPDNKKFAFTIIDDTDNSTLENAPLIYDYLISNKVFTTKSVWVRPGLSDEIYSYVDGETLENTNYFNWVKEIQIKGVEICLHSMSWSSSTREQIISGFSFFEENFGNSKILIQHNDIKVNESIYWGSKRLVFPLNLIFDCVSWFNPKGVNSNIYQGEIEKSIYFWGDICKKKIKYIRNFVFPEINLFNVTRKIFHRRKSTKFVNNWFISTEAPDIESFVKMLTYENIDKLENQNGLCIIYTHFGNGFVKNGILDERFKNVINYLSNKNGWYVPASEILDYLETKNKNNSMLTYYEEILLSTKWLLWKIFHGTS